MFRYRFRLSIQNSVFLQLAIIAGLIGFNFAIVQFYDSYLSEVEKTVDLAESNGTFSQQIPLYAKFIREGKMQYSRPLYDAIDDFNRHIGVLKQGGISPEDGSLIAPIPPQLINGFFRPVEIFWQEYQQNAKNIADAAEQNKVFLEDKTIAPQVEEDYKALIRNHQRMLEKNDKLVKAYLSYFDAQQENRDFIFGTVVIINIFFILLMIIYIIRNVVRPISKLNEIDKIISEGNFDRQIDYTRNDELGKVARSINSLFQNLRNATDFIINIGEGKLDTEYMSPTETEAKHDRLGAALLEMRHKMRQVNEADRQRNWVSEGLAKFAEIFRTYNESDDFTYIIISNLVKYVGANQGGLFIVEDEKDEDSHLELVAAYAYEKRKYVQKSIDKGEGLIGEVFQEGEMIYMTEVPDDYVHITSGLGDANPRSILLVPLKLNDEIYGVVELASFDVFEPYKIEFVKRLGESIASTFASVKTARQTQKLLRESIQLSEQMKAQEEEMRQNLEELVATQEEAQRKYHIAQEQKTDLEKEIERERMKLANLEAQLKRLENKNMVSEERIKELEIENEILKARKAELEKTLEA